MRIPLGVWMEVDLSKESPILSLKDLSQHFVRGITYVLMGKSITLLNINLGY
jgi:hypothetical protein